MFEKFIITLYEKIPINDNIMLYKKCGVVKDAIINFNDDFEPAVFYDENNRKMIVENMRNQYSMVSDDKLCYNYPLTMDQIEYMYPNLSNEELIKKYEDELSEVLEISVYDKSKDVVKILTTNEAVLKKIENDKLFDFFSIEYISTDENKIQIRKNDILKMIKMLKNKKYKRWQ